MPRAGEVVKCPDVISLHLAPFRLLSAHLLPKKHENESLPRRELRAQHLRSTACQAPGIHLRSCFLQSIPMPRINHRVFNAGKLTSQLCMRAWIQMTQLCTAASVFLSIIWELWGRGALPDQGPRDSQKCKARNLKRPPALSAMHIAPYKF